MTRNQQLFERAQRHIPGGVNSPVRAFRSVGGTPCFFAQRRRPAGQGRRRQVLPRLRRLLGAADPRPCPSGRRCGRAGSGRATACPSARRPSAKSNWPNCCANCVPSHGHGAPGLLRHRGDDERDPPGARLHRARPADQVRRLLPRPRRQPAGQGRLGRADLRQSQSSAACRPTWRSTRWCSTTTMPQQLARRLRRTRRRASPRSSSSRWPAT